MTLRLTRKPVSLVTASGPLFDFFLLEESLVRIAAQCSAFAFFIFQFYFSHLGNNSRGRCLIPSPFGISHFTILPAIFSLFSKKMRCAFGMRRPSPETSSGSARLAGRQMSLSTEARNCFLHQVEKVRFEKSQKRKRRRRLRMAIGTTARLLS